MWKPHNRVVPSAWLLCAWILSRNSGTPISRRYRMFGLAMARKASSERFAPILALMVSKPPYAPCENWFNIDRECPSVNQCQLEHPKSSTEREMILVGDQGGLKVTSPVIARWTSWNFPRLHSSSKEVVGAANALRSISGWSLRISNQKKPSCGKPASCNTTNSVRYKQFPQWHPLDIPVCSSRRPSEYHEAMPQHSEQAAGAGL